MIKGINTERSLKTRNNKKCCNGTNGTTHQIYQGHAILEWEWSYIACKQQYTTFVQYLNECFCCWVYFGFCLVEKELNKKKKEMGGGGS
jgi:hypothetical protein